MEGFIAIGLLMLLMIVGVPVAWSFAGVLAYMVYIYDANLNTLMLQGYRSVDSVILIALPLFVLTGYLMQSGGIARRLVDFIEVMIGKRRGGMGASMIMASGIFGAIAGTATAAVASIGTIMIEPLEKRGYPRSYFIGAARDLVAARYPDPAVDYHDFVRGGHAAVGRRLFCRVGGARHSADSGIDRRQPFRRRTLLQ